MALPLVPFVAGAVIGGLGVYFYRDQRVHQAVRDTVKELPGKVRKATDGVSGKVTHSLRDAYAKRSATEPEASSAGASGSDEYAESPHEVSTETGAAEARNENPASEDNGTARPSDPERS